MEKNGAENTVMWMNHLCRQTRYTGQKKATAQWTKLALKSVNFGLIYIDKNYLVQWEETTQIASLVKGRHYTPGQICYKTSALRDTPCEQCAFQKAIEQGKIIRHTIQIDQVDFEVTATPVYDNEGIEIIGGLLRFEDITEKVKMDKMLQEAKEKAD